MRKRVLGVGILGVALAALTGIFIGAGAFTFHYGEGWSYFSDDPSSCVNCHVMRPQFDSWHKATHGRVATCNDCHMPQSFPHDLIAKTDNGWRHSWAFTFDDFDEPIQIIARNQRILEDNCLRCHGMLAHGITSYQEPIHRDDRLSCLHCHAHVGHGPRR
jgi:cytochrome c nitrite reductase small subunit